MSKVIKLKKGLDIKLNGKAEKIVNNVAISGLYAVKPTDFRALTPKLAVQAGDQISAGDVLFMDKANPDIKFTTPVSGTVESINRGERRKLLEVVIKADEKQEYTDFGKANVNDLSKEEIIAKMLNSGVWTMIIQRPYGIIANPSITPKAVYVSGFDSAPLAPEFELVLKDEQNNLQAGIDCFKKITGKDINLGLRQGDAVNGLLEKLKNVTITYYNGPHPAGNVGIQINHTNPINKGEHVWTVDIQNLVIIGRLFNEGRYNATKIIALTGSQVEKPAYYKVISGIQINNITKGNLKNKVHERIISGNILTGTKVEPDNFLGFYDNQITVIPEGDYYEFLGWAMPGLKKFSASKLFPSFLCPNKRYNLDTNLHGELRAYVITEQYEKVFPMDIMPVYLIKAVLANDIDKMEQLGIYEVLPEDMALCEFVCTSKTPVQEILESGIDLMMRETN
ncbi:MAG: Na(+)-translocating NADH-quinone reductase subunit A [Odoribacter sp.]|nr:Na(+)-translocating NADH-quinone reductase subunit A [Odoribacter sp.]